MAYHWGITEVSGRMARNRGQREEKDPEGPPPAAYSEAMRSKWRATAEERHGPEQL